MKNVRAWSWKMFRATLVLVTCLIVTGQEYWDLFAPPPRRWPGLFLRCERKLENGWERRPTFDLMAILAQRAQERRFGSATRLASYTYSTLRTILRSTDSPNSDLWRAASERAKQRLERIGALACGPCTEIDSKIPCRVRATMCIAAVGKAKSSSTSLNIFLGTFEQELESAPMDDLVYGPA